MIINPQRIHGFWDEGYALDFHTKTSALRGHDEDGRPVFDTQRTELGELLYRLKYKGDRSAVVPIAKQLVTFVRSWSARPEVLVPIPPSKARRVQPLLQIADACGAELGIPVERGAIRKAPGSPELKELFDFDDRTKALAGVHSVQPRGIDGKRVLLLDDLYRSGATMSVVARLARDEGHAIAVYALTVTRTRSLT